MRYHAVALLAGASAAVAGNTATLLLPGFQEHDLQAGVLGSSGDATTYLLSCPTTAANPCGSMTAIAAPSSAVLINTDSDGQAASLSCNIAGTTYASCHAHYGTREVQNTMGSKDINWMPVTVTGPCSTSTPIPKSSATPTHTSAASTITPTSTFHPSFVSSRPMSSPKKSTSRPASSSLVTSSATVAPTTIVISETPETAESAASSPMTTSNAAVSLADNAWTLGGAVLALVYALV